MSRTVDAVVIGSGHNGLVAAAYLARAGWSVEVLEQADHPGGAVITEELTVPGYRHDTLSSWHPLFHTSGAWAELGDELRARGLEYVNFDDVVTATARGDGSSIIAHRDPARTAAEFGGTDGDAYLRELGELGPLMPLVGGLLGAELHSVGGLKLVAQLGRTTGVRGGLAFAARCVASARAWMSERFAGPAVGDLLAPWVLHTGMSPDDAGGAFPLLALAGGLHEVGMPIVRGGSAGFTSAFVRLIEDHGGTVRCGVDVERIAVSGGRASGVIAGEEQVFARRAVIANTTPTQLYGRLLKGVPEADPAREQAQRFRYCRRSGTQIHLALSEAPRWRGDARLAQAAIVHVTDGLDSVSCACAQAASGLLPARPTIVCGQPTVADPSRVPEGAALLWIQLQEVPINPIGDAAGEIDVCDGSWSDGLADAYADRVVSILGERIENLSSSVIGRAVVSAAELERRNPNFVGGDIYSGAADLDQSYLWRPLPGYGSHATPVEGLHQCGASTHPGPGLNAASGRIVAQRLLRQPLRSRLPPAAATALRRIGTLRN